MKTVAYPAPDFKTKREDDKELIFCLIRKKWNPLTPEEWVRQNFIAFLVQVLNYPAALIAVEKEILLGDLKKRFDILVYNQAHQPWLMVECKEPEVPITETVLQQVLRYNMSVPVRYMILTNGATTIGWRKDGERLVWLEEMPVWVS